MVAKRIILFVAFIALTNAQTDETTEVGPSTSPGVTERSFSIEASNAPNPQFEWDAVQCLSESYVLHPDDFNTVVEDFGKLYQLKHAGIWRVNAGCSSLYISNINITIVIKVSEGTKETPIVLYN